jgi:hypothetical protein
MNELQEFQIYNPKGDVEYFLFFEGLYYEPILFHLSGDDSFNIYSNYTLPAPLDAMKQDYPLCLEFIKSLAEPKLSGYVKGLKCYTTSLPLFLQDYGFRQIRAVLIALGLGLRHVGFNQDISFLNNTKDLHNISYNKMLISNHQGTLASEVTNNALTIAILPLEQKPQVFAGTLGIGNYVFDTFGSVFQYQTIDIETIENQELNYGLLWDVYLAIEISAIQQMKSLNKTRSWMYIPEHFKALQARDLELVFNLLSLT